MPAYLVAAACELIKRLQNQMGDLEHITLNVPMAAVSAVVAELMSQGIVRQGYIANDKTYTLFQQLCDGTDTVDIRFEC